MARQPGSGGPQWLDVAVGARVRTRRRALGLSQQALAQALGLPFQQVQRYEAGARRLDPARLADIARALRCEPRDLGGDPPADGEG